MNRISSIKIEPKEFKNIPIWDQFHHVTFDTFGPLCETNNGNRYILVAIDHYSKWCEAKVMVDHDAEIVPRFLEDEVICMFSVPKYIIIDNGSEWSTKFDQLCKNCVIIHQYTVVQWPKCNGMA
jgi:hypothetical protein